MKDVFCSSFMHVLGFYSKIFTFCCFQGDVNIILQEEFVLETENEDMK